MEKVEQVIEYLDKIPLKAKSYILKNIDKLTYNDICDICYCSEFCKSPIETILAIALFIKTNGTLYFENQMEINCNDKKYYADFGIFKEEHINEYLKDDFVLIIECDGYDFHQKTKRQVENDNKREYDIKMLGYDILRFSGSEIYNDVDNCVDRILDYIKNKGIKNE